MNPMIPPPPAPKIQPPWSPARALVWAALWALVAVLAIIGLTLDPQRAVDATLRARAFLLWIPFMAAAVSVFFVAISIRAVPRTRAYRAQWSPAQRAQHRHDLLVGEVWKSVLATGLAIAVVWVAGVFSFSFTAPQLATNLPGLVIALEVLVLFAMLWIPIVSLALRRRAANTPLR